MHELVHTPKQSTKRAVRKRRTTKKAVHKNVSTKKNVMPHNVSLEHKSNEHIIESNAPSNLSIEDISTVEIIEVLNVVEPLKIDQNVAYTQLTEQMTRMMGAVLINSEEQHAMQFEMNGMMRSLMVAKIDGDGNCLFGAICHQLFQHPIGSPVHNDEIATLRANVVNHILNPENFPSYEHILKDRVYEIKKHEDIVNMTQECKLYVRHSLSLPNRWGGHETIVAAGEIHQVNVLIFHEEGIFYVANRSSTIYNRTITLAYRLGSTAEQQFNHYDSVSDMDSQILFDVSSQLAQY